MTKIIATCYTFPDAMPGLIGVIWNGKDGFQSLHVNSRVPYSPPKSYYDISIDDRFANRATDGMLVHLAPFKGDCLRRYYIQAIRHNNKTGTKLHAEVTYLLQEIPKQDVSSAFGDAMTRVMIREKSGKIKRYWAGCGKEIASQIQSHRERYSVCPVQVQVTREQPLQFSIIGLG